MDYSKDNLLTDFGKTTLKDRYLLPDETSPQDAFMRAATTEIDGALHSCSRSLAVAMYRDGTGSIGNISANAVLASSTILLANTEDITHFEVGMALTSSATATAATRAAGG